MTQFTYSDLVRTSDDAPQQARPGNKASVIGITTQPERRGSHFEQFPPGTVYLVEFEDGHAMDVHESHLRQEISN
jgi:hypothetical protein